MRLLTLLIVFILPTSVMAKEQLNILTYDSFTSEWGPGPNIQKSFEEICNCEINWSTSDSSGALLSRVKLTNNEEGFDIILGIDDSLMFEAKDTKLFSNHSLSKDSLNSLNIDWSDEIFVPFDYGYFSFIYNSSKLTNPPKSFDELAARDDIRIIIMDPRTSTPGLGLAKWIYQLKGDDSKSFWTSLQDQIVITSKSWSDGYGLFLEGEGDIVLSYSTSPAYHAIAESDESYEAALFQEGHAEQIEVMGILKNAPNKKLAEKFLSFALSKEFQKHIPFGNWMYPVIDGIEGTSDFYKYAPTPIPLERVYGSIEDKNSWIEYWSSSIE
jgi:thiamine transport system substrate-binding protein